MHYSLPESSVLKISQATILEWVAGCSPPVNLPHPGSNPDSLASLASHALAGGFFTTSATSPGIHALYLTSGPLHPSLVFCLLAVPSWLSPPSRCWALLQRPGLGPRLFTPTVCLDASLSHWLQLSASCWWTGPSTAVFFPELLLCFPSLLDIFTDCLNKTSDSTPSKWD